MAIVIEDGTGTNPAANSYASEAELSAYATARGITLTKTTDVLLIIAMDTLETRSYQGHKSASTQPLKWPRTGVVVNGSGIESNVIPADIKTAQIITALSVDAGNDPTATIKPGISRKKVDVIEIEYKEGSANSSFDPKINLYLKPYLAYLGGMSSFSVSRL
jgi:hypothetical protein